MSIDQDQRIVMTLDAGGTKFAFSAVRAGREIVAPITLPSHGHDLQLCLRTIVEGFTQIHAALAEKPVAISFAFPGPTDYASGVIGDLANLPAFRGGVPLGPMLEEKFRLPVFINNDGDLFAYGEAIAGLLPEVNEKLAAAGAPKRYKNLLGITLGTGFGAGIVHNGRLFLGDNGAGAEIWDVRSKLHPRCPAEEGVSIRAVERVYREAAGGGRPKDESGAPPTPKEPKEIFEIATGRRPGDQAAARRAFEALGESIGDALANAITLVDGLVVIGGGLSGAAPLFLPRVVAEMNGTLETIGGAKIPRMELKAFNLEDPREMEVFLCGNARQIPVPGAERTVSYDPLKRIGVGLSRLGTSVATSVGAYAFALHALG
jgi:glucokinase